MIREGKEEAFYSGIEGFTYLFLSNELIRISRSFSASIIKYSALVFGGLILLIVSLSSFVYTGLYLSGYRFERKGEVQAQVHFTFGMMLLALWYIVMYW